MKLRRCRNVLSLELQTKASRDSLGALVFSKQGNSKRIFSGKLLSEEGGQVVGLAVE
jgi:hypothetical protein